MSAPDMRARGGLAAVAAALVLAWAGGAGATPFPLVHQTSRALGMGGAYTAVANDAGALIYNPAGLARVDGFQLDLVNLEAEFSKDANGLVQDLKDLDGSDVATATDVIRSHVGEHFRLRADTFPNVAMPGFGAGVLAQAVADGEFHSPVNPRVDVEARAETVGMVGLARGVGPGKRLALGATAKIARRQGSSTTFTAVDVANQEFDPFKDLNNAETDFALDLGAMYAAPLPLSPTVAVAGLNLTDLDFGPLGTVPAQVNLGAALHPDLGPVKVTLAADWVDVTNNLVGDKDTKKRLNYGAEAALGKWVAVRGGVHQGYYTAGATLDLVLIKVDAATFGEELGAYGGQREDRRYIVRVDFF